MDRLNPERLKDRLKTSLSGLKKPALMRLPGLRRDSNPSGLSDVTFSPEEMMQPGIVRESESDSLDAEADVPEDSLMADDEILEGMEKLYYEDKFDATLHELKKLPATLDQHVLAGDAKRLSRQKSVVANLMYANILEKQSARVAEMTRVDSLKRDLEEGLAVCRAGRKGLAQARMEFTGSSLGILAAFRRRQQTVKLLHDLNIIRTLQKTDERLQELLSESDFPGAIQLLLECQKVVATYKHFSAVRQLSSKLQDTLEMTEEQLDVALAKVCVDFNSTLYSRLHTAYRLLGKTQTSMDQLHMHLTHSIHNTAWNVVFGHAMLSHSSTTDAMADQQVDLSKKPYPDLCESMESASIVPCLVDLCRALWNIMNSYRQIVEWHEKHAYQSVDEEDLELNLEKQYVSKKLENGKMRIWQDVQTKTKIFVVANDLSNFSIDNFLEFIDVIHKLIEVGHDFCGSQSDTLQESLKKQCWNYFYSYHLARLDELKMHLENEGWALCPVKPTFKVHQLTEFRHLKSSQGTTSPKKSFPRKNDISPFDYNYDDNSFLEEDVLLNQDASSNGGASNEEGFYSDDSDNDVSEELRRDFVDEKTGETEDRFRNSSSSSARGSRRRVDLPVLTNTSLMLLRLWGKYLHLMKALGPIASNVFSSMTQLLDLYVLVVHEFFSQNLTQESRAQVTSVQFAKTLRRIEEDLIRRHPVQKNSSVVNSPSLASMASNHSFDQSSSTLSGLFDLPSLCPSVLENHHHPETLFGLPEKFVAVESALYLVAQFRALKTTLKSCLTGEKQDVIEDYDRETLSALVDLRRPVYMTVASESIKPDIILQLMSKVAWDIKEVRSQHSQYVEVLLRDFQLFSMRLQDVRKSLHIPLEVRMVLWDLCTNCASHIFVEGFSSAKRCSNEGRALMQLDYRQFVVKLEKMSEIRPLPYQDYVTLYVKAYYIPELDLEAWVKLHNSEYTAKQLVALVNCVAYSNNKTKQKLNNLISDLSGRIRR